MAQSDSCPLAEFRRFRALLDALSQPAIVKDTEGRIALANEAASRLWNKKPEQLVGLSSGDLVDPASARWAEAMDTVLLYSSAPKLLRRRMRVRGQQSLILVSIAPVYLTRGGRPDGIIVVVQPNGKDVPEPAESAEATAQRQLAQLALIKCELRDEEHLALSTSGPDLSEGVWLPLKRLLKI